MDSPAAIALAAEMEEEDMELMDGFFACAGLHSYQLELHHGVVRTFDFIVADREHCLLLFSGASFDLFAGYGRMLVDLGELVRQGFSA